MQNMYNNIGHISIEQVREIYKGEFEYGFYFADFFVDVSRLRY